MATSPIKMVVVTGPECSGKSTLCAALSEALNEPWVPEFAVEYLTEIDRNYTSDDLIAIAEGQLRNISEKTKSAQRVLIVDTGIEVIEVWHRDKIGPLPERLRQMKTDWHPDLFLLCKPDIPYQPSPLREDEHRRNELFEVYEKLLTNSPVQIIAGVLPERIKTALEAIENLSGAGGL
ncbi:MAG: ATP-binding protein [Gammaproteobacteria bacterium]|nr:ATP-binding protein [Gammaproteobacteria bacterium]